MARSGERGCVLGGRDAVGLAAGWGGGGVMRRGEGGDVMGMGGLYRMGELYRMGGLYRMGELYRMGGRESWTVGENTQYS